jgi:NAD-dependent deacetylase
MTDIEIEGLKEIRRAAELIKSAKNAIALTGAGYSTPSGIPDFRSAGSGLWTRFLPMEVASLSTFRYDPEKFFAWLHPLASHMLEAEPNEAHIALAKLEKASHIKAVITQNIDGLHHRAGSKRVYEIHGTLNTLTCTGCFTQHQSAGLIQPYLDHGEIPRCPECSRILKPDVILFEEQLPVRVWLKAQDITNKCDLMLVVGTSLEVMPSAVLPVRALDNGAKLIIINKGETYIDVRADILIRHDVVDVIPKIAKEIFDHPIS